MRTREAVFSLSALFFCSLLAACGLFLLIGVRISRFYEAWIALPQTSLPLIGGAFLLGSSLLLFLFFWITRRRYLLIRMGGSHLLKITEEALAQMVYQVIKAPCDVIVRKKEKIEILIDLPYGSEEKLAHVEKILERSLAEQIGYLDEFLLNVRMQPPLSAR